MNPVTGIISLTSSCFQCRNIIFDDSLLDEDLGNDVEISFCRLKGSIHLMCHLCIHGILGNEDWGIECSICLDRFCICVREDFQFYQINLVDVLMGTQVVFLLENQIWDEISFFHRHHMVRATARVN